MPIPIHHGSLITASRSWRGALVHGVLALGLTVSSVADACTLDALLRLPLERLLELRIGAQQLPQGAGPNPPNDLSKQGVRHAG